MSEPETLMQSHYVAVREEIMWRLKARDRYIVLFLTATAAIAGAYTTDARLWGLVACLPVLAFITGIVYAHTEIMLGNLGSWMTKEYTPALEAYETKNDIRLPHWDGSKSHARYIRSVAVLSRYAGIAILLLGVGVAASRAVGEHDRLLSLILVLLSIASAAYPIGALRVRRRLLDAD